MKTLILGQGFVGSHFKKAQPQALCADRIEGQAEFFFDFENEKTWDKLPEAESILITFKIENLELCQKFYRSILAKASKVFILATAKCYQVAIPDGLVNEESRLHDSPRNRCEEWLRLQGCTILPLGLIHGAERSIEKWLRERRIKNGRKMVNLIHIDQLIETLHQLMHKDDLQGQRINIVEGSGLTWQSIAQQYQIELPEQEVGTESKIVGHAKLRKILSSSQDTSTSNW